MCCVLGDELDRTLIDLCDRNPDLAAIVLETTGVAEPLPIAWAVRREPVSDRVRLAAVVAIVDAVNFRASRTMSPAVDAQVAYADVLLVSKRDLATAAELAAAEAQATALAPRARARRLTDEHSRARAGASRSEPGGRRARGRTFTTTTAIIRAIPGSTACGPRSRRSSTSRLEDRLAELPANYVRIKGVARAVDGRVAMGDPHWVAGFTASAGCRRPAAEPSHVGRVVALGSAVDVAELARGVTAATLAGEGAPHSRVDVASGRAARTRSASATAVADATTGAARRGREIVAAGRTPAYRAREDGRGCAPEWTSPSAKASSRWS